MLFKKIIEKYFTDIAIDEYSMGMFRFEYNGENILVCLPCRFIKVNEELMFRGDIKEVTIQLLKNRLDAKKNKIIHNG